MDLDRTKLDEISKARTHGQQGVKQKERRKKKPHPEIIYVQYYLEGH